MSDIQICLDVFAVAAWSNAADAKAMAIDAIDAYVAAGPDDPTEAVRHLKTLKHAYADLKLESTLAVTIAEGIERRISLLTVGVPSPIGAPTDDCAVCPSDPA